MYGRRIWKGDVATRIAVLTDSFSYPRLTLDFHTNKRIIDEVVCLRFHPSSPPF